MKKQLLTLAATAALGALLAAGCTSSETTTPGPNGSTTTTTTKGLDPVTVAQIDAAITTLVQNTPAAINDAQQISALIHGTNAPAK